MTGFTIEQHRDCGRELQAAYEAIKCQFNLAAQSYPMNSREMRALQRARRAVFDARCEMSGALSRETTFADWSRHDCAAAYFNERREAESI